MRGFEHKLSDSLEGLSKQPPSQLWEVQLHSKTVRILFNQWSLEPHNHPKTPSSEL